MSQDIRKVNDMESLMTYFSEKLNWDVDPDDFYDIDDITYDFEAEDLGLKEEAFAKISSLKQLRPLVDGQKWGIFFVEFDSKRFEVSALRKILSGLIPTRRNSADHAVWDMSDLLFLCTWGQGNTVTVGAAHFEDHGDGLPQIKMISCEPAVEDFTQINTFEQRLSKLHWPSDPDDTEGWQEQWSSAFTVRYRQVIQDSHTLTVRLAEEAQHIRDLILEILEIETQKGYVHQLFEKFKRTLIHDMTESQFADMYAQTIVYGLFSARCMDDTQDDFSAIEAVNCIPNTNPFLKNLMQECLSTKYASSALSFDELQINSIVELLQHTKTDAIVADFNRRTGGGREDPVIQFYEEFLEEYDKTQKVQRGVYYTPQPVVEFIVRAVDDILKDEFGIEDGLASKKSKKVKVKRISHRKIDGYKKEIEVIEEVPDVQILDPATGTGTFLRQTILQIYDNFCKVHKDYTKDQLQNEWNMYVPTFLLPRLNGFELMMAPYAVAHMKLAMVLKDTGYDFHGGERLQVYLTNSLEEAGESEAQMSLYFDDPLATESVEANAVKKNNGIDVFLGNPPYSGISSNNNTWITQMIEDYKYIEGVHFGERKHWLQDDYVKFIRMVENRLENCDKGILAFVNNHAFIDNPTFRCMRWHLLQTFDKIYVLNLHGNVMRKESSPNGEKDENVFDIQQGVSINIFVKTGKNRSKGLANVYHADCFGVRAEKYNFLTVSNLKNIAWKTVQPNAPFFFFIPRNESNRAEYEKGFSLEKLMPEHTTGVVTARDALVISSSKQTLMNNISTFTDLSKSDDEIRTIFFSDRKSGKYLAGDSRGWSLSRARRKIQGADHESIIQKIAYRPFDTQYIYYSPDMVDWGRENLMTHMLTYDNWGLIIPRQAATDNWSHAQITKYMADNRIHYSNKGIPIECPLYLYVNEIDGSIHREPNIDVNIANEISRIIRLKYSPNNEVSSEDEFTPLDLLDYIYAILFAPSYRKKYLEFLKFDFPRIPYPKTKASFLELSQKGKLLRLLHTQECDTFSSSYVYSGNSNVLIDHPKYNNGTIFLSRNGDTIQNVPENIWNMYFGGYQPLQKWLKDRKGCCIGEVEINHYLHIITILDKTNEIMNSIDLLFNSL